MSQNTIYVLVLDGRKDEKTEYWLKLIKTFGAESPIIIVLNKMDENPAFHVNESFLSFKYKSIKDFVRISCKTNEGIKEFVSKLNTIVNHEEFVKKLIPLNWLNIKIKLETENTNFISYQDYINLCIKESILDNYSQNTLLKFLNNLGVVVYFDDLNLRDTYVLNPDWLTKSVYAIINSKIVARSYGKLNLQSLDKIFHDNKGINVPREKYMYIISLMLKFELCYKIDENNILLPDLLSVDEFKYEFDLEDAIQIYYKYEFVPKSLFTRLVSKISSDIFDDNIWRTGVVTYNYAFRSKALIKIDEEERKLYVSVNYGEKRDYLAVLRETILKLHSSYPNLFYKTYILFPVNKLVIPENKILENLKKSDQTVDIMPNEQIEFEYDELLGYELNNINNVFVGKMQSYYTVDTILNYVEEKSNRGINRIKYLKSITDFPFNKPKKSYSLKIFGRYILKVILYILALMGGLWTLIQIIESETFKKLF